VRTEAPLLSVADQGYGGFPGDGNGPVASVDVGFPGLRPKDQPRLGRKPEEQPCDLRFSVRVPVEHPAFDAWKR
jgi:hypothetical protein